MQPPYQPPTDPLSYWNSPNSTPPIQTSRSWSEIFQTVYFSPSVQSFRDLLNEADTTLKRSMTWLAVAWCIQIGLGVVGIAIYGTEDFAEMQGRSSPQTATSSGTELGGGDVLCLAVVCLPFILAIGIALYLLIIVGIPHVAATVFGGKGEFEQTAFLYTAVYAPGYVIGSLFNLIPQDSDLLICGAGLVIIGVALYAIALLVIALKAIHDISWVAAGVSALSLPIFLFGLIACCLLLSLAGSSGG